jgi:type IV pilus assembly protein PilA
MLNRIKKAKLQKSDQGFTIIEVMIVLAIAGLILLIVFLAVPALQRNARNTSRKTDVSALLGAASEYLSNNNGVLPSSVVAPTNTGGTFTFVAPANGANSQAKMGYYTTGVAQANGNVFLAVNATPIAAGTFVTNLFDYVEIVPGDTCNGTAAQAGSSRSIVAVYAIESGAGWTQVCQGS